MKQIVIWDPEGKYWEGAIVEESQAPALRMRGVAMLPCVPALFNIAGNAGYAKRSWGSGWPMSGGAPQMICPLSIFFVEGHRRLHWTARLVSIDPMVDGRSRQGILRIAGGDVRGNLLRATCADGPKQTNHVEIGSLRPMDDFGGWTVEGHTVLHATQEGCYGLSLYGYAPGMRVAWVAATLTT